MQHNKRRERKKKNSFLIHPPQNDNTRGSTRPVGRATATAANAPTLPPPVAARRSPRAAPPPASWWRRRRRTTAATPRGLPPSSAVLPTRFSGLLLCNFEATQAGAVSPRSRQRGLQRESYGGSKGTPKQTDSLPVCPVSGIICRTYVPLILGICFSTF